MKPSKRAAAANAAARLSETDSDSEGELEPCRDLSSDESGTNSAATWECSACTFLNTKGNKCQMCSCAKPLSGRAARLSKMQMSKIAREQEEIKLKTAAAKKAKNSRKSTGQTNDRTAKVKAELENTNSNSSMVSNNSSAPSEHNDNSNSSLNASPSTSVPKPAPKPGTSTGKKRGRKPRVQKLEEAENESNGTVDELKPSASGSSVPAKKVRKVKKPMHSDLFDYNDFRCCQVTVNNITVTIKEFRPKNIPPKKSTAVQSGVEPNNNTLAPNLNFLNQLSAA